MSSLYDAVKDLASDTAYAVETLLKESLEFCRTALQTVSRSFALTIPMVEHNILAPIMVGYLEARILDSFEDEVGPTETTLEQRKAAMDTIIEIIDDPDGAATTEKVQRISGMAQDYISNPHYKELVENFESVMRVHRTFDDETKTSMSYWLNEMNFGMKKYLDRDIRDFEDLDEYCYYVAGTPSGFLTELILNKSDELTEEQDKTLRRTERDFGLFLQKVNIIRDFREDIKRNEKIFWPINLFEPHGLEPKDLLDNKHEQVAMESLQAMLANASQHVQPVKDYLAAIPEQYKGFRRGAAVNFQMAVATLEAMNENSDVFYSDRPVKITHEQRDGILADPLQGILPSIISP